MKKCVIMFALLLAALLIAVWSNKDGTINAEHTIVSKVDSSSKQFLVQVNTLKNRKRE